MHINRFITFRVVFPKDRQISAVCKNGYKVTTIIRQVAPCATASDDATWHLLLPKTHEEDAEASNGCRVHPRSHNLALFIIQPDVHMTSLKSAALCLR